LNDKEQKCLLYYLEKVGANLKVIQLFPLLFRTQSVREVEMQFVTTNLNLRAFLSCSSRTIPTTLLLGHVLIVSSLGSYFVIMYHSKPDRAPTVYSSQKPRDFQDEEISKAFTHLQ